MKPDWNPLQRELARFRTEGVPLPLWWRDDDATRDTMALQRLLGVSEGLDIPVHLAVIPRPATADLAAVIKDAPGAVPLVHGWAHENHAPDGQKKAEFGHPRAAAIDEARSGLRRLKSLFGARLLPMFVPPWNRIDPDIANALPHLGYTALSTYTPRAARKEAGLVLINTHVDPIHWKAGGGLMPVDRIIAALVQTLQDRRRGRTDHVEPLGFLSHHLVHDDAIWAFTKHCLETLLQGGATPCNLLDMKDDLP